MRIVRGVLNVVIMLSVPLWILPYWIKEIISSRYEQIDPTDIEVSVAMFADENGLCDAFMSNESLHQRTHK